MKQELPKIFVDCLRFFLQDCALSSVGPKARRNGERRHDYMRKVLIEAGFLASARHRSYFPVRFGALALVLLVPAVSSLQAQTNFPEANWVNLNGPASVTAIAVGANGEVYAGGGNIPYPIAVWNGVSWGHLGPDPMQADAMAFDTNGSLYVCGGFSSPPIAKWTGSNWSNLGFGSSGDIYAMAFDTNGNLYTGGSFTNAGGLPADNIAKWNGAAWSALASGMNSGVYALACHRNGNLYAGGNFTNAGGVSANHIAEWIGNAWSPIGSGIGMSANDYIWALAFDTNGNLYAGGSFTTADGMPANNIAKWDGATWSALGSGLNGAVYVLAFDGNGDLYAGGNFTNAGEVSADYIAKWDGATWSSLNSGMNGYVDALAFDTNGNLYVGGDFSSAGTNTFVGLVKALLSTSSYNLSLLNPGNGTNVITAVGTPNFAYALDLATNLTPPVNWIPQATNTTSSSNLIFTNISTGAQGFYRTRYVSQ
jgi:hypothetical protein